MSRGFVPLFSSFFFQRCYAHPTSPAHMHGSWLSPHCREVWVCLSEETGGPSGSASRVSGPRRAGRLSKMTVHRGGGPGGEVLHMDAVTSVAPIQAAPGAAPKAARIDSNGLGPFVWSHFLNGQDTAFEVATVARAYRFASGSNKGAQKWTGALRPAVPASSGSLATVSLDTFLERRARSGQDGRALFLTQRSGSDRVVLNARRLVFDGTLESELASEAVGDMPLRELRRLSVTKDDGVEGEDNADLASLSHIEKACTLSTLLLSKCLKLTPASPMTDWIALADQVMCSRTIAQAWGKHTLSPPPLSCPCCAA